MISRNSRKKLLIHKARNCPLIKTDLGWIRIPASVFLGLRKILGVPIGKNGVSNPPFHRKQQPIQLPEDISDPIRQWFNGQHVTDANNKVIIIKKVDQTTSRHVTDEITSQLIDLVTRDVFRSPHYLQRTARRLSSEIARNCETISSGSKKHSPSKTAYSLVQSMTKHCYQQFAATININTNV